MTQALVAGRNRRIGETENRQACVERKLCKRGGAHVSKHARVWCMDTIDTDTLCRLHATYIGAPGDTDVCPCMYVGVEFYEQGSYQNGLV